MYLSLPPHRSSMLHAVDRNLQLADILFLVRSLANLSNNGIAFSIASCNGSGDISVYLVSNLYIKYDKLIGEGLPVQKRWGYPDDVGKAVSALALGNFPYSTGQVIMIDGGITLSRF